MNDTENHPNVDHAGRYLAPDRLTRTILNPLMTGLVKLGINVRGARELHVRGRTSGAWRTVPVNPLPLDGERYLATRAHANAEPEVQAAE